ncbi:hypothetical protein E4T56_gene980 [Termitomyces sp. T112]|nr:hypothetical protein E4T56_gene980 [Termitomyces sp. T112]
MTNAAYPARESHVFPPCVRMFSSMASTYCNPTNENRERETELVGRIFDGYKTLNFCCMISMTVRYAFARGMSGGWSGPFLTPGPKADRTTST